MMEPTKEFSFCIVVPMYNEERNAERSVKVLREFLNGIDVRSSLIAVNDGSTDKTGEILKGLSRHADGLIVETHEKNCGYGAANVTGAKRAFEEGFDYVLFMDADLTQHVDYIYSFMKEMGKGIDFIKATRYARGGGVRGVSFRRWLVSWVGNLLARIFVGLPLTDYTNGFRAAKTSILAQIHCNETGFAYLLEEVLRVSRIAKSYAEVPYILTVRDGTSSKSKFRYNLRVYYTYLKYLFVK